MTILQSKEVRLKSRPVGVPTRENFEVFSRIVGPPGEGEILVRNTWMSVDPYMRGRMSEVPEYMPADQPGVTQQESYVPAFQIGESLDGGAVGQVIASRSTLFAAGDYVESMLGWRELAIGPAEAFQKIDPAFAPLSAYLGTLGMPGLTAYAGLTRVGEVRSGESVFVSAAAGAVGSVVCQLAKARGCRVVGTAGSDEKCAWLEEVAGIDKAINYRTCVDLDAALREAFPSGIDVYFANVAGRQLEVAIDHMRPFGRIPICGMVDQYNDVAPKPGPSNLFKTVQKSIKLQGFIVLSYFDLMLEFRAEAGELIRAGRLKSEETVIYGLENAPSAFIDLFSGRNVGKMLVNLSDKQND
jgi:NADPH-dependent curcumin reductase CurA